MSSFAQFITPDGVVSRIGSAKVAALLDLPSGGDPLADSRLSDACVSANSTVAGYVRRQYTIPLDQWPQQLTTLAFTIARYNLLQYGEAVKISAEDVAAYDRAAEELNRIGNGRVRLELPGIRDANWDVEAVTTPLESDAEPKLFDESWPRNW